MDFLKLIETVNKATSDKEIRCTVNEIDIDYDNFNSWVENIFSDKIDLFDMGKLPYLIDELYQTNDRIKFLLCCMLLEATCDKLDFLPNLENYPVFVAKFEALINTLVSIYDKVDNGIANCMSLIIINNDPKFTYFNDELKVVLINATKRKLKAIIEYLKTADINSVVYSDLGIIIDMSCYLNDSEISKLIEELDNRESNDMADLFIMKYKIINNINISLNKLNVYKHDTEKIWVLYKMFEELNVHNIYLHDISQEDIAKSEMVRWLKYPTELGSIPDEIELLGEFIFNDTRCFAYSFSKKNHKFEGTLLGIVGGYPLDRISANSCGYTFSKFETLSNNWKQQATELAEFIYDYWKSRNQVE